jgi:hypothetical protein
VSYSVKGEVVKMKIIRLVVLLALLWLATAAEAHTSAIQCGPYVQPGVCSPPFQQNQLLAIQSSVPFVWLRSVASSAATVVGTISPSPQTILTVVQYPSQWDGYQNWWLVASRSNPGMRGWVEQASLMDATSAPTPIPTNTSDMAGWPTPFTGHVQPGLPFGWIRSVPDSTGSILATLYPADTFTVLGANPPFYDGRQWWWYIGAAGSSGFVRGYVEQVSIVNPQPTVTSTPTFAQAQVLIFEAHPAVIDAGGTVTLYWNTSGAVSVTVWRLDPDGRLSESHNGSGTGTWTLSLPNVLNNAQFMLFATDADGRYTTDSVTVQVRCPYTYFFSPPWTSCPASAATQVQAAYQPFENGFMVWRGDVRRIYVMLNSPIEFTVVEDTWREGETITLPGNPPAGLYAPTRGFGKAWLQVQSYSGGSLGWATAPEQSYTASIQASSDFRYPRLFFTLPDGRMVSQVESSWEYYAGQS